jgi:hypothetical protein
MENKMMHQELGSWVEQKYSCPVVHGADALDEKMPTQHALDHTCGI